MLFHSIGFFYDEEQQALLKRVVVDALDFKIDYLRFEMCAIVKSLMKRPTMKALLIAVILFQLALLAGIICMICSRLSLLDIGIVGRMSQFPTKNGHAVDFLNCNFGS